MAEALTIDACRTRAASAKPAKARCRRFILSSSGRPCWRALAERTGINTADVDDIIWGTSAQVGPQAAISAGCRRWMRVCDVRASGVTLDRFCGSASPPSTWRRLRSWRARRIW